MALNFPDSPGIGSVFVDNTTGFSFEWDGTVWQSFTGSSVNQIKTIDDISSSFNNSTTAFTLQSGGTNVQPVNAQQLRVVLGGITQNPGVDYTVSGSTLTFTTAPPTGATFSGILLGSAVPLSDPTDGSVTPAKISTGGPSWNTSGDVYISGVTTANNGLIVGAGITLGDNVKLNLGAGDDLQLYHDGSHSYIDDDGTGSLYLRSDTEVKFLKKTGNENILVGTPDGSVAAFYDGTKRLETTDGGALVYGTVGAAQTALVVEGDGKFTGVVTATSFTGNITGNVTGDVAGNITGVAATFTGNVSIGGTLTYEDVSNVDSVGLITARSGIDVTGGNVDLGDGNRLRVGTGDDLQVYHDGTDTWIDNDEGDLYIRNTGDDIIIRSNDDLLLQVQGSEAALLATGNGAVELYYDANKKLETTTTGITVTGTAAATAFSGDGSALTNLPASGGSSTFTASGSISNGDTVVLNSDGTVSVISGSGSADPSVGTPAVFESANSDNIASTYDSTNNKVVIAYRDTANLNYGTAVVGTVSGTSISFGTPVVFNSANSSYISMAYDSSNQKVVLVYQDAGTGPSYGVAHVGTVSGTSISFGSKGLFESAATHYISMTYDSSNQKVVVAYSDFGNSQYGTAVVGTVSGTSISFGTPVVFESATVYYPSATFDSNSNKVVIAYQDNGNSSYGTAVVGTVSGTSISFGTPVVFNSASSTEMSSVYDSTNNKVVIAYTDNGNSSYGTAVVGTVSGTSINFGTPVVFHSVNTQYISATYDSTNQNIVIGYSQTGNSYYGTAVVGTVSGTSIIFGFPVVFESAGTYFVSATFDSNSNKVVIAYNDQGNSNYGTAVVFGVTGLESNLTTQNYIGIAAEAISSGATGEINIVGGINEGQSGLTTSRTYYVNPTNGNLDLNPYAPEGTPGVPIVVAGTSVSATKILVR